MPELPEAETIVRGLRRAIMGRTVASVEVLRSDVLRESSRRFAAKMRGRRVTAVERRGKNVVIRLDPQGVMAVNLGMTGRLLPVTSAPREDRTASHPAVRLRFSDGSGLVFDDTRRFGTVECLTAAQWLERSGRMGPEPFDPAYGAADLHAGLRASRSPVRSWLLDQRRIAGVGNIYAAEALYLSGIHPQRRARSVRADEAAALHRALRRVLGSAIRAGGTTIRDYRDADGGEGRYARRLLVYGREGEPCGRCGDAIRRIVFGGRSAFLCPSCQPRRPRPARP